MNGQSDSVNVQAGLEELQETHEKMLNVLALCN